MDYGMDKVLRTQGQVFSNFKIDSQIWPNVLTVQDFMPVLFICKFHNDLI